MDNLNLLIQYVQYNLWANRLMADWLRTFEDEHFKSEVVSSFNSIQKTLLHICDAEYVWYQRLTGQDLNVVPSKSFNGSKADVLLLLTEYSVKILEFIQSKTTEEIALRIQYSHINGSDATPGYYMLLHCMNHSTYHRGQLITMGRQLGYENPPRTDFIHFVREMNLNNTNELV